MRSLVGIRSDSKLTENRIYFGLVWGLVALGCAVLLVGLNQPLGLLVISALTVWQQLGRLFR